MRINLDFYTTSSHIQGESVNKFEFHYLTSQI